MSGWRRKMARKQMRVGSKREDRVIQRHLDVLQSIEATLVSVHRRDPRVDDRASIDVLTALMTGQDTRDEVRTGLADALLAVRRMRPDMTDELWHDALGTVANSVRRHSSCRAGRTDYLDFVGDFLP